MIHLNEKRAAQKPPQPYGDVSRHRNNCSLCDRAVRVPGAGPASSLTDPDRPLAVPFVSKASAVFPCFRVVKLGPALPPPLPPWFA
jgi:hypothetical protein